MSEAIMSSYIEISKECSTSLMVANGHLVKTIALKTNAKLFLLPEMLGDYSVVIKGTKEQVEAAVLDVKILNEGSYYSTKSAFDSSTDGQEEEEENCELFSLYGSPNNKEDRQDSNTVVDSLHLVKEEGLAQAVGCLGATQVCVQDAFMKTGCGDKENCIYYHEKEGDSNDVLHRDLFQQAFNIHQYDQDICMKKCSRWGCFLENLESRQCSHSSDTTNTDANHQSSQSNESTEQTQVTTKPTMTQSALKEVACLHCDLIFCKWGSLDKHLKVYRDHRFGLSSDSVERVKQVKEHALKLRASGNLSRALNKEVQQDSFAFIWQADLLTRTYTNNASNTAESSESSSCQPSVVYDDEIYAMRDLHRICFFNTFTRKSCYENSHCPFVHLRPASKYSDRAKQLVVDTCLYKQIKIKSALSAHKCVDWGVDATKIPISLFQNCHPSYVQSFHTEFKRYSKKKLKNDIVGSSSLISSGSSQSRMDTSHPELANSEHNSSSTSFSSSSSLDYEHIRHGELKPSQICVYQILFDENTCGCSKKRCHAKHLLNLPKTLLDTNPAVSKSLLLSALNSVKQIRKGARIDFEKCFRHEIYIHDLDTRFTKSAVYGSFEITKKRKHDETLDITSNDDSVSEKYKTPKIEEENPTTYNDQNNVVEEFGCASSALVESTDKYEDHRAPAAPSSYNDDMEEEEEEEEEKVEVKEEEQQQQQQQQQDIEELRLIKQAEHYKSFKEEHSVLSLAAYLSQPQQDLDLPRSLSNLPVEDKSLSSLPSESNRITCLSQPQQDLDLPRSLSNLPVEDKSSSSLPSESNRIAYLSQPQQDLDLPRSLSNLPVEGLSSLPSESPAERPQTPEYD